MTAITSHRAGGQGLGHGQSLPRIVTAETVTTGAGGHAPTAGGHHATHYTTNIRTVTVPSGHLCWCMLCMHASNMDMPWTVAMSYGRFD